MLRKLVKKSLSHLSSNNYETLNIIEINRSNVIHNAQLIKKQHPDIGLICVLKANAYGHGLHEISEILNDTKVEFIAVDGYFEAAQIRDTTKHRILVMGYIKPENYKLVDTKGCSFVVQDLDGINALAKLDKVVNIHLELNTGMNRLGLNAEELFEYLETLKKHPRLRLEGVMTHLADADNESSNDYTFDQVKLFDEFVEQVTNSGFKPAYIHVAQTAGSVKAFSKYANAIRLGVGLYGINPLGDKDPNYKDLEKLKPVLELKSTIIKTLELKKGDRVSYNGIFSAPEDMTIGVLPLGYYEGLPRELSNRGLVTTGQKDLKIVGRICMDHTMVDLDDSALSVGSTVVVISKDPAMPNSVKNICKNYGLFSYSFVTGISSSVRRRIV